ncbi:Methyl-CpG-binding domain-containing protein 9 [Dichanthelium oligosanthes]|uniref:Methyl-CpG-binding domain-containing protein 9 n=1 Tax=Dichanthelium oligosanthes TaxID=888268 RepID=A0A1E5W1H9_9POAL|nr:Methyl-CpG-binding domain-containing protein 9 [Dichanthelium oligosanthes]
MDRDLNADGNVPQRSIHLRRRDLPQTSTLPKVAENHEFGNSGIFMDPSFLTKAMEQSTSENRSSLKPPKFLVENSNHQPQHHTVVLPVQYGDFFITSLGEIDNRTSYHNSYQIWPVGFTSYWHDRITGSLFECEVCDGGNFGPFFKVRRLPCSVFPLPDASTTVCPNVVRKADTMETKESSVVIEDAANNTDDNISMLLSDFSGTNQDFLSCLSNNMEGKENLGCSNVQTSNMTEPAVLSYSGSLSWASTKDANMHDKIGEFSFEGTSPSSAWRMISCAVMEACEKMIKEQGHLVLFCTHSSEKTSFDCGSGSQNTDGPCNLLTRFCSSNGPRIPRFIEKENDVESTCALLKEWLYPDRTGFDLEFVQEIVESLPKSSACSNYQFLRNRTGFNSSLTIASGTLLAVNKSSPSNGDAMSHGRHGSRPQDHSQPSSLSIRELPPGNPFSRKLPAELAGDVFQVLEFLGRFAEIIGLKELPSVEQVEDELIDPWPICANQKDNQHYRDHTPPMNSPANVSTSYSNGESGLTTNEETASVFIPVETSTCEAAQDKLAAQTLGRCSGVVLPEIHLALLKILFTELVPRVAIFVDPRIDSKESKSKRGRKRDTDTLTRELKIDMLTANKLTWPELARRYILAVSSLSGCMDLSDISSREGVKLFRCLQGDGGILCGALPGVVGMEKDASLLAEAETLICNSSSDEGNKVFMMDYKDTDTVDSSEEPACDTTLPDWVKALEPVRKLPTNVGTRIRKCVYEALEKKPPEWARKILEHSISKEVYKGNASGPTKVIRNLQTAFGDRPEVLVQDLVQKFDKYLSNENGQKRTDVDHSTHILMQEQKKCVGEEAHVSLEKLNKLAMAMDKKEYWELSIPERIYLLKFLCDELLNTALIKEHLDQCSDKSNDLQQKLRYLNYELKELKYQVEIKASYATQSKWMKNDHVSNSSGLLENQQHAMPTASEHLEEAERVNIGVNLNTPAEGAPIGQLNVGKPYSTDNDISSTTVIEGNKSLGLLKQVSEIVTDQIDVGSIGEESQSFEKSLGGRSGTCDNLNMGEAHSATVINAPNGELPDENARTPSQDNLEASTTKLVGHDANNNETNNLLDRISQVQDSISTVELQLGMASLRRECLGRDSVGRWYWVTGSPGKRPRLVADGSMLIPKDRDISMVTSYPQSTFDCRGWNSAPIVIYESDEEIKCLVDWLRDTDPREKDLKDSILHWQKSPYHQASFFVSDPPVSKLSKSEPQTDLPDTKAFIVLEQKYGLQLDQDTSELSKRRVRKTKSGSEERIYRCDCLEPVWPSRYHCLTCHETYLTSTEYEGHNGGKCNSSNDSPSNENDKPKLKGAKSDIKEKDPVDHNCSIEPSNSGKLDPCPFDFEEICKKFITNDSNKETVKEIGLLGSNGVPSFLPSPAFFLDPPALLSENKRNDDIPNDWTSSLEECQGMSAKTSGQEGSQAVQDCPGNAGEEQMPKSRKPVRDSTSAKEASSSTDKLTRLLTVNGGLVPESSLIPMIGRNFHILKQLKIHLLDVEAALPEEALRASKSQQIRRRSWRAFVKGAESISHVVLATNFLQSMIKAEFLKKDWWYWSSFTAAIKTTTVSALALRIYTLDDCIMYTKDPAPNPEPADNARSGNKGKRKRDADS